MRPHSAGYRTGRGNAWWEQANDSYDEDEDYTGMWGGGGGDGRWDAGGRRPLAGHFADDEVGPEYHRHPHDYPPIDEYEYGDHRREAHGQPYMDPRGAGRPPFPGPQDFRQQHRGGRRRWEAQVSYQNPAHGFQRRPVSASASRSLKWTDVDDLASPKSAHCNPRSRSSRPHTATLPQTNHPGHPSRYDSSYNYHASHYPPASFDRPPPWGRDYLYPGRQQQHPGYPMGPQMFYPYASPQNDMYSGPSVESRSEPAQRPMSAGPRGRPASGGGMFGFGRNKVHPAHFDEGVTQSGYPSKDQYGEISHEETALDVSHNQEKPVQRPSGVVRSRPTSALSRGALAPTFPEVPEEMATDGSQESSSRVPVFDSRPASAYTGYSKNSHEDRREPRYNSVKAHLNAGAPNGDTGLFRTESGYTDDTSPANDGLHAQDVDKVERMQSSFSAETFSGESQNGASEYGEVRRSAGVLDLVDTSRGKDGRHSKYEEGADILNVNPTSVSNHEVYNSDEDQNKKTPQLPQDSCPASDVPNKNVTISEKSPEVLATPSHQSSGKFSIGRSSTTHPSMSTLKHTSSFRTSVLVMRAVTKMKRGNVTIENAKAKEMAQEFEFEEVKGCNYGEPYDWRKKRHHVDETRQKFSLLVFILSMASLGAALLQNEMIYNDVHPRDSRIEALKALNSVLTCSALIFLVKYYQTSILFRRIYRHLHRLKPLDVNVHWYDAFKCRKIWFEMLILIPHIPPFYTDSFGIENMKNLIVYRIESIGTVYNLMRSYTFWRFFRDIQLRDMPKRYTIANFTGVKFNSIFILKKSLEGWNGVGMIIFLWGWAILGLGYFFRIAEFSACLLQYKDHPECAPGGLGLKFTQDNGITWEVPVRDTFPMNGFWMMFITSTTVGYGDIWAHTHFGRMAAIIMGVIGVSFSALLTASLSNALTWTPIELQSLLVLEREKARIEVRNLAADRIIMWWRRRQKWLGREKETWTVYIRDLLHQYKMYMQYSPKTRSQLLATAHQCSVDIEDLSSDVKKMDFIHTKVKYLQLGMRSIKYSVKQRALEDQNSKLETRQAIKMGLIGYDPDDEIFAENFFKANTQKDIRTDARRREIDALQGSLPRNARRKQKRRASIQVSERVRERIEAKIEYIDSKNFAWYRQLATIDARKSLRTKQAGLLGPLGTLCAMGQNEWLMNGGSPLDPVMDFMKFCNTLFTILTSLCILRAYYLAAIQKKLSQHVHEFHVSDNVFHVGYAWLLSMKLWAELIVIAVHNPPFYTSSTSMSDMGSKNIYVMQSETLMASFNMFRLYLLWRVIRNWMVEDLPKRCTLAGFQRFTIGSGFAVKRMLHSWLAVFYLGGMWFGFLFLLAYWFRAVEVTACQLPGIPESLRNPWCDTEGAKEWTVGVSTFSKVNDYYMYNAMWFMCVTSTSVGYGDVVPTTSPGRVVAAFAALTGIVFMSLLTASMANQLQWQSDEASANVLLERERCRLKRRDIAAYIIQAWWKRYVKNHHLASVNLKQLHLILRKLQMASCVEIDDAAGYSTKIDYTFNKMKKSEEILVQTGYLLWHDEAMDAKDQPLQMQLKQFARPNAEQKRRQKIREAFKIAHRQHTTPDLTSMMRESLENGDGYGATLKVLRQHKSETEADLKRTNS